MIFPAFPQKNDCIGICAPSAGVGHKLESFDMSLSAIRQKGFRVIETASVRNDAVCSGPPDVRGVEFNSLISDSDIRAVIAASGGDYNIEMLPFIDSEAILADPKWIAGASDPTNILYYVTTKLDIATMYGFNAGTFDWRPLHIFQKNALDILSGNLVTQNSFDTYDSSRDFSGTGFNGDAPVFWDVFAPSAEGGFVSNASVDVEGRLIGGCTDVIANLIGTPYDGTADFVERYDDMIWYFDTFQMSAESVYRMMLQMRSCGYFRKTKAVIFGRVMFSEGSSDEDYISLLTKCFDVPIIFNADIGHVKPTMTFINGSITRIKCRDGRGTVNMRIE